MAEQEPPKIEFPCEYPIKVMGDAAPDFKQAMVDILAKHAGPIPDKQVSIKDSRNGKFQSVTIVITATGVPQLEAIFEDLKASGRVKMVI